MKYIFTGNGACIPGLPRELSSEEITAMNDEQRDIWKAALESGAYTEVIETPSSRARKSKSEGDALSSSKGEQP